MKAAAGLIIYKRVNQVIHYLLLQTSYGVHHWTPPKGHLDPGENDKEAAIRETTEEAGLTATDLTILWEFKHVMNYPVKGKNKRVTYWLAELKNKDTPVILSDEHQDFKWLPLKEACQFAVYEEMRKLFEDAETFLDTGEKFSN